MIKYICFDNGNVLIEDAWLNFLHHFAVKSNKTFDEVLEIVRPLELEVATGKISFRAFIKKAKKLTGDDDGVKYLLKFYPVKPQMANFLVELKRNYKLALFSNDRGDFRDKNRIWKMERFFGKDIFLSSKIGYFKPNADFFEYSLSKLGISPEVAIFVDDKPENVETARSLGMIGIQFTSVDQLKNDLEEVLVNAK